MKRETLFLKLVVAAMALVPVAFIAATIRDLLFGDLDGYTFIAAGMYVSALPFWYALYQTLKLLNLIDRSEAFSLRSVSAIGVIRNCALAISLLYTLGLPLLFDVADSDDAPGVFALGLVIVGASLAIATFAAVLQKLLESAMDLKQENDLTV